MALTSKSNSGVKRVAIFLGLALGTAAVGWVLALGLAFLLALLLRGRGDFADLGGVVMGLFGGYPLGVLLGQAIARRFYPGSLLLGLLGIVLGVGLTVLLSLLLKLNVQGDVLLAVYFTLVPLLGTAGYLWRKKEG